MLVRIVGQAPLHARVYKLERFRCNLCLTIYTATPPESLFSLGLSGAQRRPNGNTMICDGVPGQLVEIDDRGAEVWRYVNPVGRSGPMTQGEHASNRTFRAVRYPIDYPGFARKDLTPGDPIELPLCGNDFVDGMDDALYEGFGTAPCM